MKRRSSARATLARSARLSAKTHVGAAASDLVSLVTETSPTISGLIAPLAFALGADGTPTPFAIPAGTVLVITDVTVTMPRRNAAAGRYVAAICNSPCVHSRIPIQVDTAVDGFQKTLAFSGGVVFANLPQFQTLAENPSDMSVCVYGYLARRN
jgi:hypothetical protein